MKKCEYTFTTYKAYNNTFYEAINEQFKFQCDPSGKISIFENHDGVYEFKKSINIRVATTTNIKERFESFVNIYDNVDDSFNTDIVDFYIITYNEFDSLTAIEDIKLDRMELNEYEIEKINEDYNLWFIFKNELVKMTRYNTDILDLSDTDGGKPVNIFQNDNKLYIFPSKTCDINESLRLVINEFDHGLRVKIVELESNTKKLKDIRDKNDLCYDKVRIN